MTIFLPSYGTLDTLDALQHARIYGTDAEYRDALAAHYAIVSPPAVTDDAAWHAVLSGPDVPTTGPSTDEPGGPGGEPPPDDTAPIPATPAAAVCAKPVALGGGSPEQSGPYHVSNDDVVAWLFYAHPRRGWVHHGPWSRTYKRDKIRAIAARLNAMRWTDEVAL